MGDIGTGQREYEMEPIPVGVPEPVPQDAPVEEPEREEVPV